jgi:hypothetical protein
MSPLPIRHDGRRVNCGFLLAPGENSFDEGAVSMCATEQGEAYYRTRPSLRSAPVDVAGFLRRDSGRPARHQQQHPGTR